MEEGGDPPRGFRYPVDATAFSDPQAQDRGGMENDSLDVATFSIATGLFLTTGRRRTHGRVRADAPTDGVAEMAAA